MTYILKDAAETKWKFKVDLQCSKMACFQGLSTERYSCVPFNWQTEYHKGKGISCKGMEYPCASKGLIPEHTNSYILLVGRTDRASKAVCYLPTSTLEIGWHGCTVVSFSHRLAISSLAKIWADRPSTAGLNGGDRRIWVGIPQWLIPDGAGWGQDRAHLKKCQLWLQRRSEFTAPVLILRQRTTRGVRQGGKKEDKIVNVQLE